MMSCMQALHNAFVPYRRLATNVSAHNKTVIHLGGVIAKGQCKRKLVCDEVLRWWAIFPTNQRQYMSKDFLTIILVQEFQFLWVSLLDFSGTDSVTCHLLA
jgi:hypothetical protein